jgi:putative colanic acid biosynthesis UDP-glucose lipid carrier transferase
VYHKGLIVEAQAFSGDPSDVARKIIRARRSRRKRVLDVTIALTALLFLFPLLLGLALLIRLESPGPVMFRQRRGGLGGRSFVIYKLRTMRVFKDEGPVKQATRNDSRITPLGAFLRRTSLDELPQLINVLRGDMSLVGPRPHAIDHDLLFSAALPNYTLRTAVKPGLTGMAQVSGLRGEIRNLEAMAKRIELDLKYIENWSLLLDVRLIWMTFGKIPYDKFAY